MKERILEFIMEYYKRTFFFPTYREIGKELSCSTDTVFKCMRKLAADNLIRIKSKSYRLSKELLFEIYREKLNK